jgi:hypothetical protein
MNKIKRNTKKIKYRTIRKKKRITRKRRNHTNVGGMPDILKKMFKNNASNVTPQPESQDEKYVEAPPTRVIKQAHEIASENDNALRESIINKIDEIAFTPFLI